MSNAIQFLEALGNQPALSAGEYAATIATLGVDEAQRQALLDRDQSALSDLLGGREKVYCIIATPEL